MNRKFELSKEKEDILIQKGCNGKSIKFYRIVALKDIFSTDGKLLVKKGEKGGFVFSEKNLSQEGSCWIYDDAEVFDDAIIADDAEVRGKARVYGDSNICEKTQILDLAQVFDSLISNNVVVCDNARVISSSIKGNLIINSHTEVVRQNINLTANPESE